MARKPETVRLPPSRCCRIPLDRKVDPFIEKVPSCGFSLKRCAGCLNLVVYVFDPGNVQRAICVGTVPVMQRAEARKYGAKLVALLKDGLPADLVENWANSYAGGRGLSVLQLSLNLERLSKPVLSGD